MRRNPGRLLPSCLALLLLVVWTSGCTATRTREFTREVYEPGALVPASSRVFTDDLERVREALVQVLTARGASVEAGDATGLVAVVPWTEATEAAASVDMGRTRLVVTQTERGYRSWSPLDFRCDACIVRKGRVISQETKLVRDDRRALDPARYRIEASLRARIEPVRSGTRVELELDLAADPPEPPEILPRSTGRLENRFLDDLEAALLR